MRLRVQDKWGLGEVVGGPERVDRARPAFVEPDPRLALAAPVHEAHPARVQPPALPLVVVPSQPVLVPPVVHRRYISGEHQQKRRQRPQLIDPHLLLQLHPRLDPCRVPSLPPPPQVHHHHPRVEVARPPPRERQRQRVARPECAGEVVSEVRFAVLRRRYH
uniref:Uncharacterized protein n=1 Tax=Nymphaea colorata TaxID=210225 RepID=A0A5K1CED8_9MAGN